MNTIEEELSIPQEELSNQWEGVASHTILLNTNDMTDTIPYLKVGSKWKVYGDLPVTTNIQTFIDSALIQHIEAIKAHFDPYDRTSALDMATDPQTLFETYFREQDISDVVMDDVTVRFYAPVVTRYTLSEKEFSNYVDGMLNDIRNEFTERADEIIAKLSERTDEIIEQLKTA
ncbi:hypothetical protein [Stenotrophomonas phage RAS14]